MVLNLHLGNSLLRFDPLLRKLTRGRHKATYQMWGTGSRNSRCCILYPVDASIRKTAIVVESDRQASLAESFIKIAEDLPQTFKVFSNLANAEDWVKV